MSSLKIAIVYDWFDKWGGVERILLSLKEIFPGAVFYTSYFDEKKAAWAKDFNIKTSFIAKFPAPIRSSRILSLPFYPYVFESFNLRGFDLVISVTSSFAKSVITGPGCLHLCYLLTPTRFLWSHRKEYIRENISNRWFIRQLKEWDLVSSARPDEIIAISETVRDRCLKYYQRQSEVIYPPFDREYWSNVKSKILNPKFQINTKYYLIVSRLEPYKKVALAVETFNRLKKQIVIVGEGSEEGKLKNMAGKNILFFKKITDEELAGLYNQAEALVMPQEEDFGYVSLEGQFFGCPVIALNRGGARETIIDYKTGLFFKEQSTEALTDAIERFEKIKYNFKNRVVEYGVENVGRFEKNKFREKLIEKIRKTI